jgi:phosphotransferase system enzyme I (PtsI)
MVSQYYTQHHPAVLMLIRKAVTSAQKAGIPISVCGEMASELMYVPIFVGLGINELSINPAKAAEVRMVVRNCDAALTEIISNFDFNADVESIEKLINQTLKPYYTIQS